MTFPLRHAVGGAAKDVERTAKGTALLYAAVERGDEAAVSRLLAGGADGDSGIIVDPNSPNSYGYTPLYCAAKKGHAGIVRLLLRLGSCGEEQEHSSGDVSLLLDGGGGGGDGGARAVVLVNTIGAGGSTPLFAAVEGGHTEVVELLLLGGGIASLGRADRHGHTALFAAAMRGHADIVRLLLRFAGGGALTTVEGGGGGRSSPPQPPCAIPAADVANACDASGRTALFIAAEKGYTAVVEALLKNTTATTVRTAASTITTSNSNSAGSAAAAAAAAAALSSAEGGRGVPSPPPSSSSPSSSHSLLFLDVNKASPMLGTPLYVAVQKGHAAIVRLLLTAVTADGCGAVDVDAPHCVGGGVWSPLLCAIHSSSPRRLEMVELLLAHGASVAGGGGGGGGGGVLYAACVAPLASSRLRRGEEVGLSSSSSSSASLVEVLRLLLASGADPLDGGGCDAKLMRLIGGRAAKERGHEAQFGAIRRLLLEAGCAVASDR